MATQQTATVYIANNTDGDAWIELYHENSSNGTQSGRWLVPPGGKSGPLTVNFETGIGSYGVKDYWWVNLMVINGSTPGQYVSGGSVIYPGWKECQLRSADAGQTLNFSVDTTIFNINEDSGACTNSMDYVGPYIPITNVFVLMLENHSFDNMFAMSGIPGITAATTSNYNTYNNINYNVQDGAPLSMPTDPGHEFPDVVEQLGGVAASYPSGGPYPKIDNSGFAANYATTTTEGPAPSSSDIGDVMSCFNTQEQLPVMYQLATEFALCDQWFSSLPGPTWPNRFFVHGASSAGLDHSPTTAQMGEWLSVHGFDLPKGSIYDAMNSAGMQWRIYNDDLDQFSDDPQNGSVAGAVPQVASLKNITLLDIYSLSHFPADLQNPYPYKYTFIEPNYGDVVSGTYAGGSSQHPMDDVYGGEALIQYVYEAIRNSPLWDTSLLIITYDEHGGFYDSVAPGAAVAPNDGSPDTYNQYGFDFKQYGVRVPAIIVSPLIANATVDGNTYDHASVLATVEQLFGLSNLTDRDGNAQTLLGLLGLSTPRTDCPATLKGPNEAMKRKRVPLTAEEQAAIDLQPIPEESNLVGFLHIMLKTEFEMSGRTEVEKAALVARFKTIRTRGEARIYIHEVMAKVKAFKANRK